MQKHLLSFQRTVAKECSDYKKVEQHAGSQEKIVFEKANYDKL